MLIFFLAAKIAFSDLKSHKILNTDLSLLTIYFLLHHKLHLYFAALMVLIVGLIFQRFIGAGDTKYLALIVLSRANYLELRHCLLIISIGMCVTALIALAMKFERKKRIPLGPALSLGLTL